MDFLRVVFHFVSFPCALFWSCHRDSVAFITSVVCPPSVLSAFGNGAWKWRNACFLFFFSLSLSLSLSLFWTELFCAFFWLGVSIATLTIAYLLLSFAFSVAVDYCHACILEECGFGVRKGGEGGGGGGPITSRFSSDVDVCLRLGLCFLIFCLFSWSVLVFAVCVDELLLVLYETKNRNRVLVQNAVCTCIGGGYFSLH